MKVNVNDLKWYGRYSDLDGIRYFDYSSSGFEFCFTGKKAVVTILSDPELFDDNTKGVIGVYLSELSSEADYKGSSFWEHFPQKLTSRFVLLEKENVCTLFESDEEKTVLIKVLKLSEVNFGCAGLKSLEIDGKLIAPQTEKSALKLEIIGDSITCGYGIEGIFEKDVFTTKQQRPDLAYGFLTAKNLGLEFNLVSWSGIGIISKYVDASVEVPDTTVVMPSVWPYVDKSLSLRRGLEPQVWDESRFSPDIVVLHLGTNDASFVRNHEDRRLAYVCGLRQFLEAIHRRSPKAKICCCLGVMGQDLCASVEEAVNQFHGDFKNVPVKAVKFPVQLDEDGIGTDWHPSAKTHEKIAKILSDALKEWV